MADSYIQIPTDGTGKKVRSFERTVGANDVHEHFMQIVDADTGTPIAGSNPLPIYDTSPATEFPLPAAQLAQLAPNNYAGGSAAAIISDSATMIVDEELTRHSFCITNNGSGFLYVSGWPAVATSGAFMGHKLYPGGSFTTEYTGPIYGIYSTSSAVHNVAYTWVQPGT